MDIINRTKCAICNNDIKNIYSLNNVPIKLACILQNKQSENPKTAELSYSQCINCHTIQLDKLIPLDQLYSESHNYVSVGNTWENYFKTFVEILQPHIIDKNVIEIGCPSGKIAQRLFDFKNYTIVDPNKNPNIVLNDNMFFDQTFFDENYKPDKQIDIIVHSHLFEHIYEPNKFLNTCNNLLADNGVMIFGIPNMEFISNNALSLFSGIFFEHTIFLNKENVSYMLNNNGFEIIDIIDYENHSIIFHCQKKTNFKTSLLPNDFCGKITNYYHIFMRTIDNYKHFLNKTNDFISKTKKNVYIFGTSYNTQLLISLGLDISNIKGILDNCKEKQGRILYGYNLLIYDPSILKQSDSIVILKNGVYITEIQEQIKNINNDTVIINTGVV